MSIWDIVKAGDTPVHGKSYGWIQWKGTEVCIDLHCVCGHMGHVDDSFFYFYQCPNCNARYAVGQNVVLIPLTEEQSTSNDVEFKTDTVEVYDPA